MKVRSIYVLGDYGVLVTWLIGAIKVCSIHVLGDYSVLVTSLIQSHEGLFDLCSR